MTMRSPDLEIPENDPFRNDKLDRKQSSETLTRLIENWTGSLVFALDSAWGTGKTTFLRMWQQELRNSGHVSFTVNAWRIDYADDPMVALISELSGTFESLIETLSTEDHPGHERIKRIRETTVKIVGRLGPAVVRGLTYGALDLDKVLEKEVATALGKLSEDGIAAYEAKKMGTGEFRKNLEEVVQLASEITNNESARVVIIVDELDRCRPTYAIEFLERIKHLFDVPGVIFTLGIDRRQLEHSICGIYGSGFDSHQYLKRFIDLDYRLPISNAEEFVKQQLRSLKSEEILDKRRGPLLEQAIKLLANLSAGVGLSARSIGQTISRLLIVCKTSKTPGPVDSLSSLLFLREWNTEHYLALKSKRANIDDIIKDLMSYPRVQSYFQYGSGRVTRALIYAGAKEMGIESHSMKTLAPRDISSKRKFLLSLIEERESEMSGPPSFETCFGNIELSEEFDHS